MASRPPAGDQEHKNNRADFRVSIGGETFDADTAFDDATGKIRPRLMSLRLTEKRGGEADALELTLDDSDGKLAIPEKGAIITLQLGWARGTDVIVGLVDKGRFKVDEASWSSAPAQITLQARSADLTGGFRIRRERSHRETTLGAVAKKIAAAAGLTAQVAPSLAGIAVPILVQDHKSDMALLRELGRRHDAIATVKGGKLILAPIGAGTTASGKAIPAAAIAFNQGDRAVWRRVDREKYSAVEARWHDRGSATRKTEKASVKSGSSGSGEGSTRRLKRTYHNQADAKAAAAAEAGRITRRAAELTLDLALGRPDLYPDRKVSVSGFKPVIDGAGWLISELTHVLDARGGLSTALKLETTI